MGLTKYLIIIFLFISGAAFAQKNKFEKFSSNKDYKTGSVQLPNGTWRQGLIKDKVELERYNRVTFIDSLGNKTIFRPKNTAAYTLDGKQFKGDPATNHFYQRVSRGAKLSIYQMRFKPTTTEAYSVSNGKLNQKKAYEDLGVFQFYYKESEGIFHKIPQEGDFHLSVAEFLKDCPELSEKIKNKEFGKNDVQSIMNVYNFQCNF